MKKYCYRLAAAAASLSFALSVRADTTYSNIAEAASGSQDLSRVALTTIFGNVVTDPFNTSSTTVIGNMFALFNSILCGLALIWFCIIGIKHLYKAGHTGKVFSSGDDAIGAMTTLVGFLTIVPTGSGWALSQLVMLWAAATMGVGSANLIVQQAGSDIAGGYALTVQPTSASTRTAARAIFEMKLCQYAINSTWDTLNNINPSSTQRMSATEDTSGNRYTITISNGSGVCGTASVPTASSSSSWNLTFNAASQQSVTAVYTAQRNALTTMMNTMDTAAYTFVNTYEEKMEEGTGTLADAETIIQNAASVYEDSIQQAITQANNQNGSMEATLKSYLDTYGWLSLGAWYQTFATANQRLNEVAGQAPSTSGFSNIGAAGNDELYQEVMTAYRANLQNTTYTPTAGTVTSAYEMNASNATDPKAVLLNNLSSFGVRFTSDIATIYTGTGTTTEQVNPLMKMKNVGDYTMVAAETVFTTFAATKGAFALAKSNLLGRAVNVTTGILAAIEKVLDAVSPAIYFLVLWLFVIGLMLSIFLPSIPFIFWMTGVVNWIVSVMVACAAGPLWAATHLGVSEDRGGRATYGYIYLIDVMIRPTLMVLGFMFASVAIVAAGTILHALFGTALANIQADSITGIYSIAGFLMVYTRICTSMVSSLFALQAYLPDQVIAFIGGRDGINMMGGMVDSVKGIFVSGGGNVRQTPGMNMPTTPSEGGSNKDGIKK